MKIIQKMTGRTEIYEVFFVGQEDDSTFMRVECGLSQEEIARNARASLNAGPTDEVVAVFIRHMEEKPNIWKKV